MEPHARHMLPGVNPKHARLTDSISQPSFARQHRFQRLGNTLNQFANRVKEWLMR
jgi:hypothetical protein